MMGINGISPYYTENYDRAYFFGALKYYGKKGEEIIDLSTDIIINKTDLFTISNEYKESVAKSSISVEQIENCRLALVNIASNREASTLLMRNRSISINNTLTENQNGTGNICVYSGIVVAPQRL